MFVIGDEYFEIEHHMVHAVGNSYIILLVVYTMVDHVTTCSCHYLHHYYTTE